MFDASVDAIVSDPPYGLSFMGKGWDHAVPGMEFWIEALRVAKPGAHLVAFGGTRTFHRLAVAIEDAGWEIRDCLSWLYGSGFSKSLDVGKAMDKAAGALKPESVGFTTAGRTDKNLPNPLVSGFGRFTKGYTPPDPVTDLARRWHGWGTALKPAWEPIIVARKPLAGTVATNVAEYGTGGINVDGCRIVTAEPLGRLNYTPSAFIQKITTPWVDNSRGLGRWPANVVLDEDAAEMLGEPSRFFYCAKASRSEREAGLEGMPVRLNLDLTSGDRNREDQRAGTNRNGPLQAANVHPTVKPISLMRWLCRLVTPPGGLILDPFTGSGTTGCAAVLEGFDFVGAELSPEYADIARRRITHWADQVNPQEALPL